MVASAVPEWAGDGTKTQGTYRDNLSKIDSFYPVEVTLLANVAS